MHIFLCILPTQSNGFVPSILHLVTLNSTPSWTDWHILAPPARPIGWFVPSYQSKNNKASTNPSLHVGRGCLCYASWVWKTWSLKGPFFFFSSKTFETPFLLCLHAMNVKFSLVLLPSFNLFHSYSLFLFNTILSWDRALKKQGQPDATGTNSTEI